MDENFADLLKGAFADVDIDFEHLQLDEATNMSQTQLVLDEDMDDVDKMNVYEAEGDDEVSENSESSESSNPADINTESTHSSSPTIDSDQGVENLMTDVQELKQATDECTKEGNMQEGDSDAGVSLQGLFTDVRSMEDEKQLQLQKASRHVSFNLESAEYQPPMEDTSHPVSTESQIPEKSSSESGEEESDSYGALEDYGQIESDGNKVMPFVAVRPADLKEFTEEDQEQIEESLADYPSDFSPSESEECAESSEGQQSILTDNTFCYATKDSSGDEDENLPDHSNTSSALVKNLEVEAISEARERDIFEEDQEDSPSSDIILKEDATNEDYAKELSDDDDEVYHGRDDDNASHENTGVRLSVKRKEEWKRAKQNNIAIEDMVKEDDYQDTEDSDENSLEEYKGTGGDNLLTGSISGFEESSNEFTRIHYNLLSDQSEATTGDHIQSLWAAPHFVHDAQTLIQDMLSSSEILVNEDNLLLEEYDWNLTGEQILENLNDNENLENAEEPLEDLDNFGENDRDWEQEKIRIEAFNRFYGDQDTTEDYTRRNHKVTFSLDQESSDYEDDSDSSDEELDEDPVTPLQTIGPEYYSDSDEEQEKPSYSEKSKPKPKVQHHVSPALKQPAPRNKCSSVLKFTSALVLVVAVGMAYFWWTTETQESI